MKYELTLEWLQEAAGENGHTLETPDLEHAKELLRRGMMLDYVANCAGKWADEYARVSWCEGQDAARFEARNHS